MSIEYPRFSIDITSDGNDILVPTTTFRKLIIKEMPNSVPECELYLESMHDLAYTEYNDIRVNIASNDTNYVYDIGVKFVEVSDQIKITGLLCKNECFNEVSSAYLGEDLDSAINALDIKDNVIDVSKVSGDYWQIHETKLQALERLMKGCMENSIYVVSNDSITAIDMTDQTDAKDFIQPSKTSVISYSKVLNSDNIYNLYIDEEDYSYNAVWMNKSLIGTEHKDYVRNYISSLRYRRPPSRSMQFHYDNMIFPYNVGDLMKINIPRFNVDIMRVIGKIVIYTADKYTTDVLLGIQGE